MNRRGRIFTAFFVIFSLDAAYVGYGWFQSGKHVVLGLMSMVFGALFAAFWLFYMSKATDHAVSVTKLLRADVDRVRGWVDPALRRIESGAEPRTDASGASTSVLVHRVFVIGGQRVEVRLQPEGAQTRADVVSRLLMPNRGDAGINRANVDQVLAALSEFERDNPSS